MLGLLQATELGEKVGGEDTSAPLLLWGLRNCHLTPSCLHALPATPLLQKYTGSSKAGATAKDNK